MCHSSIKLSLKQEGDQKPINSNDTIMRTLIEEENDSNDNCKRSLKDDVHVLEQIENEFEVYIF